MQHAAQIDSGGLEQQSRSSYLPHSPWKVKKGLRRVHERIKSLMRLRDKTRERKGSSAPCPEHVSLLNLSVEIGFGAAE